MLCGKLHLHKYRGSFKVLNTATCNRHDTNSDFYRKDLVIVQLLCLMAAILTKFIS